MHALQWLWLIMVAANGGFPPSAIGAEPSLAAAVPSDAGLCVEVRGLDRAIQEFRTGPWMGRLTAFPPAADWATTNMPRLRQVARQVGQQLEIEPQAFLEQVVGQEVVVAIWPGEVGRAEPGPGAILVRAADSVVLSHLVERWVALGRRSGPARVREAAIGSHTYYVQASGPAQPAVEVCVAAVGNVGVVANREHVMRQVLELLADDDAPNRQSLANLPEYQAAQSQLSSTAPVRAFVQPRQWDALLSAGLKSAADAAPQRQQLLFDTWLAAEYWATALDVADRITLESYVSLLPDNMPPAWRELVRHHGGNATFLEHVPAEALIALAGRANLGHWLRAAVLKSQKSSDTDLQELRRLVRLLFLGWDPLDRVLAQVGPDWGAYLLPSADSPAALHWVIGVSLQPPPEGSLAPSVAEILTGGIRAGLTVTSAVYNIAHQQPLSKVTMSSADGQTAISIAGIPEWPAQLPSVFICRADVLLAATSQAAASPDAGKAHGPMLANHSKLQLAVGKSAAQPSDLLYIDLRGLRDWLSAHSDAAIAWIAQHKGITTSEAAQQAERLRHFLQLADTAIVAIQLTDDSLRLTATAE